MHSQKVEFLTVGTVLQRCRRFFRAGRVVILATAVFGVAGAEVQAQDPCPPALQGPEATQPVVLAYDEFAQATMPLTPRSLDGAVLQTHPMRVTGNRMQFDQWSATAAATGGTAGAISILDCTNQQWIPFSTGDAVPTDTDSKCNRDGGNPGLTGWVNVVVYDQATLDAWNAIGFIPAFLDESLPEEQAILDEAPSIEETVFDLEFDVPGPGTRIVGTLRVRKSDGAIAVLSLIEIAANATGESTDQLEGATSCDAGFWWHFFRACCISQKLFCEMVHRILPNFCIALL